MTAPNLLALADMLDRQPAAIAGLHDAANALRWSHERLNAAGTLTDDRIRAIWNEVADRTVGGYLPFAREIAREIAANHIPDIPEADCTDLAHPAWWRGHEYTAVRMCQMMQEILDGKPADGTCSEPWQSLRVRLAGMAGAARFAGKVLEYMEKQQGKGLDGWDIEQMAIQCGLCRNGNHWEGSLLTEASRAAIEAAKGGE